MLGYSTGSQRPLGNYRAPKENPVTLLSIECRNLRYLKSNAEEFAMRQVSIAYPEAILRFSKLPWRESYVEESC